MRRAPALVGLLGVLAAMASCTSESTARDRCEDRLRSISEELATPMGSQGDIDRFCDQDPAVRAEERSDE